MSILREMLALVGFRVDKASQAAAESAIAGMKSELSGLAKVAQYATGIFLGTRVFKFLTSDFTQSADAALKAADAYGVSAEFYQGLGYAAQASGTKISAAARGLLQLGKSARDALRGSKAQLAAFNDMGIQAGELPGLLKKPESMFLRVSDALAGMAADGKRSSAAMTVMGTAGAGLLPLMTQGADGVKKLIAEGKKLGAVVGDKALHDAVKYNDAMLRFKTIMIGLRNQLAARFIPMLTRVLDGFARWAKTGDNLERVIRKVKAVAEGVIGVFRALVVFGAARGFLFLAAAGLKAAAAIRAVGLAGALAMRPFQLIALAITAIVLIIEDLHAFATGSKQSLLADLIGDPETAEKVRAAIFQVWAAIQRGLAVAVPLARELAQIFGGAILAAWEALSPIFAEVLDVLGEVAQEVAPVLVDAFRTLADTYKKDILPAIVSMWEALKPLLPYVKDLVIWAVKISAQGFKTLIPILGSVVKWLAKVLAVSAEISAKVVNGIAGAFKKVVDFVKTAIDWIRELAAMMGIKGMGIEAKIGGRGGLEGLGGDQAAANAIAPILLPMPGAAGGARTVNQHVAPPRVTINVSGAGDPQDVANRVNDAAGEALQRQITGAMSQLQRLVPGAT